MCIYMFCTLTTDQPGDYSMPAVMPHELDSAFDSGDDMLTFACIALTPAGNTL